MRGVHGGSPPRFRFVDGMRGLAALYVVFHHAALLVPPRDLSRPAVAVRFLLRHGHSSVAVFIVLSGFCLMRPLAAAPPGQTRGGFWRYLGRRARRILPPYYAALALCWLLVSLVPALGRPTRSMWDRSLPLAGPGVIWSHLLLLHNLSPRWLFKFQPPLWSVATEWQIYLLFPALLFVWRRAGIGAAVGAGFGLGFAVAAASVPLHNPALRLLCPWYLGLFTLGMAAAVATSNAGDAEVRGPRSGVRRRWTGPAAVAAIVPGLLALAWTDDRRELLADPLVGAVTAALIVRWTRICEAGEARTRPPLLRLLESRGALALGAVSYSLYLTHFPLLALAESGFRAGGYSADVRLAAMTIGALPACLAAAYIFYRVFERPLLIAETTRDRTRPMSATSGDVPREQRLVLEIP